MVMSRSFGDGARAKAMAVVVPAGWVLVGLMMLSTAVLRWVSSGPGSRFGGLELADNLRTGALSPDWGGWVALVFYSIVAFGGVLIATAVVERRSIVAVRGAMCFGGVVSFAALGWGVLPIDKWGAGPTISSISFVLSTALSAFQLLTSSRT
jgi:hypothetical protein